MRFFKREITLSGEYTIYGASTVLEVQIPSIHPIDIEFYVKNPELLRGIKDFVALDIVRQFGTSCKEDDISIVHATIKPKFATATGKMYISARHPGGLIESKIRLILEDEDLAYFKNLFETHSCEEIRVRSEVINLYSKYYTNTMFHFRKDIPAGTGAGVYTTDIGWIQTGA